MAHDRVRQGALARAVGSHQRVDLALGDAEVDATKDLPTFDAGMETLDREHAGARIHSRHGSYLPPNVAEGADGAEVALAICTTGSDAKVAGTWGTPGWNPGSLRRSSSVVL